MTDAHDQIILSRVRIHYPEHDTRESDPHYSAFKQFEHRCKKLGIAKCIVDSDMHGGPLQCHHSKIEFSLQDAVDVDKFNKLYGLHLESEEEFKNFVESPGNAEWLCLYHHVGAEGIHVVPEPIWQAIRVTKDALGRIIEAEKSDNTPLHQESLPDGKQQQ